MADEKHLEILREGVEVWNQWRKDNPKIIPNLIRGDLINASLNNANLVDANLSDANLAGVYLCGANLTNAYLVGANLTSARLTGANFNNVKLKFADLKTADLNGVNLNNADLTDTELSRVQAIYTNFKNAILTGACIEDWNTNSGTNFEDVKCDYVYLKWTYSKMEKKCVFSDRRPHDPNKIFAPGEFTKRYQKLLETVDIYFDDGIDWQAFLVSFNKLQIECDSNELSINSFENKGDGAFVIKVNVPNNADKAEIEKYLKKQYQLEATVEAQQRELTNLYEVTKLLASKPMIIENNIDNQNGKFGIGHNESDISGNAKIAGEINEVGQQEADK